MSRELLGFWVSIIVGLLAILGAIWRISRRVGTVSDRVEEIPGLTTQVRGLADEMTTVKADVGHIKTELSLNSGRPTMRDTVNRIDERTLATGQALQAHIARCSHG